MFNSLFKETVKTSLEVADIYRQINRKLSKLAQTIVKLQTTVTPGKSWACNVVTRQITYSTTGAFSVSRLPAKECAGLLFHEIGHALYSTNVVSKEYTEKLSDSTFHLILNSFEDIRIELNVMRAYPGTWDMFKALCAYTSSIPAAENVPDIFNYLLNVINSAYGVDIVFNSDRVKTAYTETEELFKGAFLSKSTKELASYLVSSGIVEKIMPLIDKEKPDESGEGGSPEEGDKEESEESEKGKGVEMKGKKEEKKEEKGEKEEEEKSPEEKIKTGKERIEELLKETRSKDIRDLVEIMGGDYEAEISTEAPTMFDETKSEIIDRAGSPEGLDETYSKYMSPSVMTIAKKQRDYIDYYNEIKADIPSFSARLKSILRDNKVTRWGGGFLSGKLNGKNLYEWRCNNMKLFKRKVERQDKDYSVCLLVDESGSMGIGVGSKMYYAVCATVLLAEVLHSLKIPFEILGFNKTFRVYKTYTQNFNMVVKKNIMLMEGQASVGDAGDNNDGYAVNWANYRLSIAEGNKVLLVLSDGQPDNSDIPIRDPKEAKRLRGKYKKYTDFNLKHEVNKASKISTCIGIGINSKDVENYYPKHIVVRELRTLPTTLISMLKRTIKRI